MVLLELTPEQAEVVRMGLLLAKEALVKENIGPTERERKTIACDVISDQIIEASKKQEDVLIGPKDLFMIVSYAKDQLFQLPAIVYLADKKVEENDFKHIALANAVIMWLNKGRLLKRLPRFDFTDNSSQYEETE